MQSEGDHMKSIKNLILLLLCFIIAGASTLQRDGIDLEWVDLNMYGDEDTRQLIERENQFAPEGRGSEELTYGSVILIGNVPSVFFGDRPEDGVRLSQIKIEDGLITELKEISVEELEALGKSKDGMKVVTLSSKKNPRKSDFDIVYPGLIDLHNHPKQNNLPTWPLAKGQFNNRFEWSKWTEYKYAVSKNINPWVNFDPVITCAAFRWSEMQAMILGTTYMQGYVSSGCVSHFSIHRVEDSRVYRYEDGVESESPVSAPSFLLTPQDFTYVWNYVRPKFLELGKIEESESASIEEKIKNIDKAISNGATYDQALLNSLKEFCPDMIEKNKITEVTSSESLEIITDKNILEESCREEIPKKLIRYMSFYHGGIASRHRTLDSENQSGVVAHLAEGRSTDPYNRIEFPMLKMMGLARKGMNFVHGIGINQGGLKHMAENEMGLVWSPYSNLLLYGETLDLEMIRKVNKAQSKDKKLLLAIGSDWVPTGSKTVLEEIKLARKYIHKLGLADEFTDYDLYKMMTENPARLINHFHTGEDGEHGIGTIAEGAIGTLIVLKKHRTDPFNNIVEIAGEGDVNLVVVDGNVIYGEPDYLSQAGYSSSKTEELPNYLAEISEFRMDRSRGEELIGVAEALYKEREELEGAVDSEEDKQKKSKMKKRLKELDLEISMAISTYMGSIDIENKSDSRRCRFTKGFVHQEEIFDEKSLAVGLEEFQMATGGRKSGLNLNRVVDLQKLLGVHLITESVNARDERYEKAMSYFPSLYSCNDLNDPVTHGTRLDEFVQDKSLSGGDEMDQNAHNRERLREEYGNDASEKMKEAYGL